MHFSISYVSKPYIVIFEKSFLVKTMSFPEFVGSILTIGSVDI
jgi:hypothetical protein